MKCQACEVLDVLNEICNYIGGCTCQRVYIAFQCEDCQQHTCIVCGKAREGQRYEQRSDQ